MDELKKLELPEIHKEKIDFTKLFANNKEVIYAFLFYSLGLTLGAYFYNIGKTEALNTILTETSNNFVTLLISNLIVYLSIFLITTLIGFSLIGFAIINLVPMMTGIFYGLKCACYYSNYSAKGFGYILLLIAPVSSLLILVIANTISYNSKLSKSIYKATKRTEATENQITNKEIIKHLIIQLVLFLTVSVINSIIILGLENLITI